MNYKILSDDGYIVTLIRPCEMQPMRRGETIRIEKVKEGVDLNRVFETMLTEDMVNAIIERLDKNKNAVLRKTKAN